MESCSVSCSYAPPRQRIASGGVADSADGVASLMSKAGIQLLDWQCDVIADWSAVDEHGQFVHRRCGLAVPRQAGKSVDGISWAVALVCNGYRVLWTDHNYSTTCEMLRRFREIFGRKPNDRQARHPAFNKLVRVVNSSTGQEAIEFTTGGVLCFSTRTKSATLGYSFDVVIYDEAQELTDEQMQAILPTFTSGAMHNPQAIFLGTPPRPGNPAGVFRRIRRDAWTDEESRADLCWWEWGVDEIGDTGDESRWREVNPSIMTVASLEAIRTAHRLMGDLEFAQEYLGYWLPDRASEPGVIDECAWDALATERPPKDGKLAFGIKFALDGSTVALVAAIRPKDGPTHLEAVAYRSMADGMSWLVDFVIAHARKASGFVIDGGGNARDLCDKLSAERAPRKAYMIPQSGEVAAACAGLLTAISEGKVTHFAQPALDECITHIRKRQIGRSGFGFEGIDGMDPSLSEAAALALWGVANIKRDPNRRSICR